MWVWVWRFGRGCGCGVLGVAVGVGFGVWVWVYGFRLGSSAFAFFVASEALPNSSFQNSRPCPLRLIGVRSRTLCASLHLRCCSSFPARPTCHLHRLETSLRGLLQYPPAGIPHRMPAGPQLGPDRIICAMLGARNLFWAHGQNCVDAGNFETPTSDDRRNNNARRYRNQNMLRAGDAGDACDI